MYSKYLLAPRPELAIRAAQDILLQDRPRFDFPLNPAELRKRFPDVEIIMAKWLDAPIRAKLKKLNSEAFVINYDDKDFIFLDYSQVITSGRARWNQTHEFAHVALYHFDDFDVSWLRIVSQKDPLARWTLYVLNREADIFTTELLMPYTLVQHLSLSPVEIQHYFGVSKKAALKRYREIRRGVYEDLAARLSERIIDRYDDFISKVQFDYVMLNYKYTIPKRTQPVFSLHL